MAHSFEVFRNTITHFVTFALKLDQQIQKDLHGLESD